MDFAGATVIRWRSQVLFADGVSVQQHNSRGGMAGGDNLWRWNGSQDCLAIGTEGN